MLMCCSSTVANLFFPVWDLARFFRFTIIIYFFTFPGHEWVGDLHVIKPSLGTFDLYYCVLFNSTQLCQKIKKMEKGIMCGTGTGTCVNTTYSLITFVWHVAMLSIPPPCRASLFLVKCNISLATSSRLCTSMICHAYTVPKPQNVCHNPWNKR